MSLIDYIQQQTQIEKEPLEASDAIFQVREYKKYSLLLKEGSPSQEVFFIEKGIVRQFYTKEGKDITHAFYAENSFYTSLDNIYFHQSNHFGLEVLETCRVRIAEFVQVEAIINNYPKLERFMRMLLISFLKNLSDRLYAIKFQTAQERYELLLKNYPQILLRVPLGHVASFLGITQQTLSVIRAGK